MKSSIAILATLSLTQAQSSGWQNQPSVQELSQEKFRCGCPMPAPKVTGCQAALPVKATGCGCQPATCNPKPVAAQVPHPTKVLALQCHDVTSWKQETVTDQVERVRQVKIPKTKMVTRAKMGYKKTTAIRYRQKMVEVDEMKWETRQVQKTTYRTVTENVRVVAPPQTRMDCCGRTVAVAQNPCSCAAPVKYINKTISKQVPVNSMVTERVQVPCKVKKMVNEPYEVTVNMPMPGEETVEEKYFEYKDERYTEPVQRTTRIPIVTRQCTDASGKLIEDTNVVPLHASGPTEDQLVMKSETQQPTAFGNLSSFTTNSWSNLQESATVQPAVMPANSSWNTQGGDSCGQPSGCGQSVAPAQNTWTAPVVDQSQWNVPVAESVVVPETPSKVNTWTTPETNNGMWTSAVSTTLPRENKAIWNNESSTETAAVPVAPVSNNEWQGSKPTVKIIPQENVTITLHDFSGSN